MDRLREQLIVRPRQRVHLAGVDPNATFGHTKQGSKAKVQKDLAELQSLQERIWAERRHRVLIVLQGLDTAGKDGTILHVMSAFNPQSCRVARFGVPTDVELAHDYLWRVHAVVPASGEIVVFNRSHYESVLVERVHKLVPRTVWSRRYAEINDFEGLLTAEGTTILKFFLYIDPAEQLKRLQARLDDPTKRWKFRMGDLDDRKLWDDYTAAYEEALRRCSTKTAPWYIIPANHKWFRDLAVGEIVADTLRELDPRYPVRDDLPKDLVLS